MIQAETQPEQATARRYTTLWVLLAVFAAPYLFAAIFYFTEDLREELPLANRGTLLSPLVTLPVGTLPTLDGERFDLADHRGRWLLLYVNQGECDRRCETTLYYMRQVRLAMGRERFEIERVAALPAATDTRILGELAQHQPEMFRLGSQTPEVRDWLSALPAAPAEGGRLYILDREGRAALYFDEVEDPKDLLDDLKRLIGGRNRA